MHLSQGYTYHLSIAQAVCALAQHAPVYLMVLDTEAQFDALIMREFNITRPQNLAIITIKNKLFGIRSNTVWFRPSVLLKIRQMAQANPLTICYTRNIKTAEFLIKWRFLFDDRVKFAYESHQLFSINLALNENYKEAEKESARERLVYSNSNYIFTNTKLLSRMISSKFSGNATVLPLAVDRKSLITSNRALLLDRPVDFVYAGKFNAWKGVSTMLEALQIMHDNGWRGRATLIGLHEDELSDWVSYVKKLGLINRVDLSMRKPRLEVNQALDQAKVGIIPNSLQDDSIFSTSPLKLYDYAARALQIVASRTPALDSEINLTDVEWFRPDDPASLAQAMSRSLKKYTGPSEANLQWARENDWESRAQKIIEIIKNT